MGKVISLSITNEDLYNACLKLTKDTEMAKFFANVISDSPSAVSIFMHIFVGGKFPDIPKVDDIGYIEIEKLYWGSDRDKWRDNPANKHGFILVKVVGVSGLHSSYPLQIKFPDDTTMSLPLDLFIPEPNSDIVRE